MSIYSLTSFIMCTKDLNKVRLHLDLRLGDVHIEGNSLYKNIGQLSIKSTKHFKKLHDLHWQFASLISLHRINSGSSLLHMGIKSIQSHVSGRRLETSPSSIYCYSIIMS